MVLSQCCVTVVTQVSLCYRSIVALLLRFCGTVIALLSCRYHSGVALLFCCSRAVVMLLLRYCWGSAVTLLSALVALLSHCCRTLVRFFFPFNSCSTFFSFFRCQRIVASAVFSFYIVFQLELSLIFRIPAKLSCLCLNAFV